MARDRTKHAYYTVGIPLESETYRALKADAEATGVTIPQLLAVRITDWYKQATAFRHVSAVPTSGPTASFTEPLHNHAAHHGTALQSRAAAAAAAWGGDDDEER